MALAILTACSELGVITQPQQTLPEACRTDCVTPYAQILGTAPGNVAAYSNCNAGCVIFTPNTEKGTYTGIKWQCVEFARRWLLGNLGVVYGDVNTASDIWNKIQFVTQVSDNQSIPLRAYENGSAEAPKVGDLLIYGKEYLNTGHVAVITDVELHTGILKVAEQNYLNQSWPGNYSRQIDVINRSGRYWVLDPYLLGWKRVAKKH
jgi:glutathionylspermidine amidase/synthetase